MKTHTITQSLNHNQFLHNISNKLNYKPDSANYSLYQHFIDTILSDGGDDDFANDNPYTIAFYLSELVTLKHIEQYDNTHNDDYTDIYLEIKSLYLNKH